MEEQGKKSHRPSLSFPSTGFISRLKLRSNNEPPPSPVETEHYALLASDPELDVEPGLPVLEELLGARAAKALNQQERKRQDILNELLHTERLHVRVLKVLEEMFRKPLLTEYQQVAQDLFPELDQILGLHREFNKQLHARRDESPVIQQVADVLLSLFDGDKGRLYREACAAFCRQQTQTLWSVKKCKDPQLAQLMSKAESSPICRQMKLKDMMSAELQRLAKYPVFIEDIVKNTDDSEELRQLDKALQKSKNILAFVKQTVIEFQNYYRLSTILNKLDKSSIDNSPRSYLYAEVRNLDARRNTLVYDGVLSMKLRSHRTIEVHVVLLENIMVLLQKQDDKFVLCNFNDKETYKTHSPLLQRQKLLAREDAADKKAFMVINSQAFKPEMYQFAAQSQVERDRWVMCLNRPVARAPATPPPGNKEPSTSQENSSKSDPTSPPHKPMQIGSQTADSLIQPHEVHISDPAGQAEQVLTPTQKLHRNDHALEASLEERKNILADIKVDTVWGGNHDDHHSSSLFLIKEAEEINYQLTQLVINSKCLSAPETSQSWSARTGQQKVTLPIPVEQLQEVTSKMNHCISKLHVVLENQTHEKKRLRRKLSETHDKLESVSISTQLTPDVPLEVSVDSDMVAAMQPSVDEATDGDSGEEQGRGQGHNSDVEEGTAGSKAEQDIACNSMEISNDVIPLNEELGLPNNSYTEESFENSAIEDVSTTDPCGDITIDSSCSMSTVSTSAICLEDLGDTDTDSVQTLEGVVLPGGVYAEDLIAEEQAKTLPDSENSGTHVSSEESSGDLSRFYPDFRL